MNLATCSVDGTPLRVLERRKGDERGPLLVCPSCERHYDLAGGVLRASQGEDDGVVVNEDVAA